MDAGPVCRYANKGVVVVSLFTVTAGAAHAEQRPEQKPTENCGLQQRHVKIAQKI